MDFFSYFQEYLEYKLRFTFYFLDRVKSFLFVLVKACWKAYQPIKDTKVFLKVYNFIFVILVIIYLPLIWIKDVLVSQWKEIEILSAIDKASNLGSIHIMDEDNLKKIMISFTENKRKKTLYFYIHSSTLKNGSHYLGNINRLIDDSEDIVQLLKDEINKNKDFIGKVGTYYFLD